MIDKIHKQLEKYFGAIIIGSAYYSNNGLIDKKHIDDIDFMVLQSKQKEVEIFLSDNGYASGFLNQYYQHYGCASDRVFKKKGFLNIHILYYNGDELPNRFDNSKFISEMVTRGDKKSLDYAISICERLKNEIDK